MPPKKQTPAPIDRPLSRAYLREFTGWSTAYPPGLSDPTSLRIMENMQVNTEGSVRVRPGLRYLSYTLSPEGAVPGLGTTLNLVGTHEVFFLNDGSKAYLFAVRETNGTVGFRVLSLTTAGAQVLTLTDPLVAFAVPQGEPVLNFSAATTYVKYLQIDNKIFALSNAGESLRIFYAGAVKSARKITSLAVPAWQVADKLSVIHPEAAWINSGLPTGARTNKLVNPSFEVDTFGWVVGPPLGAIARSTAQAKVGIASMALTSLPTETNLMTHPLHNVTSTGTTGWASANANISISNPSNGYMRITANSGSAGRIGYAVQNDKPVVVAGQSYRLAYNLANRTNATEATCIIRWFTSGGVQIGSDLILFGGYNGRQILTGITAPAGATKCYVFIGLEATTSSSARIDISNVRFSLLAQGTAELDGDNGTDYFWTGSTNNSTSVYHPPADVTILSNLSAIAALSAQIASLWFRSSTTGRSTEVGLAWYDAGSALLSTSWSAVDSNAAGWEQVFTTATAPAGATQVALQARAAALPRNQTMYVDTGLLEDGSSLGTDFDGSYVSSPTVVYAWNGVAHASSSTRTTYGGTGAVPTPETPAANTLIGSVAAENTYNYGFFYAFSNEIGESKLSQVTVIRAKRGWSNWLWQTPNVNGEPSGTPTADPDAVADQLVAIIPIAIFDAAVAQGAVSWSLYALTWSDQDSVPVTALKIAEKPMTAASTHGSDGWARATPQSITSAVDAVPLPNEENLYNYSEPSRAGQGLVGGDRLVLVNDPTAAAVIRWSSNNQGDYSNFSANLGGGYKTLTSGNLFIPACVKLWQNPQSVDTLTILCLGVDGYSTGYYMAPASVQSQSDATSIMGFEETTATPGTSSPYGCEVVNNALFHPLDSELMKSTASNYNINHKSLTEQIENRWKGLENKDKIVSALHDNKVYYIVYNPEGAPLEADCMGNEIWVFDSASEKGTWSRFLIQAVSLRKIESGTQLYMSVVRPDGIYYLDPLYEMDDYIVNTTTHEVGARYIPWKLETNTQGANRAHDAWAYLQQMQLTLGNWQGSMKWGVRGTDANGKPILVEKTFQDLNPPDDLNRLPFDIDDFLRVARTMQQWYFFAESLTTSAIVDTVEVFTVVKGYGQLNLVQYRYTPSSVNTGYEHGSVETFEYGRATANWAQRTTDGGVPSPFIDTGRP